MRDPQPRRSCVRSIPLLLSAFCALPLSVDAAQPYPTDRCVSRKLQAAALECRAAFSAWARFGDAEDAGRRERELDRAAQRLARRWQKAEAAAAGVDCAKTTVGADELADLLEAGAAQIAAQLDDGGPPACGSRRLQAAGETCAALLRSEARHLVRRGRERERSRHHLEAARGRSLEILDGRATQGGTCSDAGTGSELAAGVAALADEAAQATTVSPAVSTEWTLVTPEAEIEYDGRTLQPMCWDGAPYVFFVKRGTVNRLLVYYQGGGACWDAVTCGGVPELGVPPTFKQTAGPGDDPTSFSSGFADLSNPLNPFRDWHAVFVPYCTGDVHWGDAEALHEWAQGSVLVQHKGYGTPAPWRSGRASTSWTPSSCS